MSLRFSLAAALVGMAVFAAPAFAVMQVVPLQDPNTPAPNATPPDGLFNKSFSDHWQKKSTDGQQGVTGFHFTFTGGASSGYTSGGSTSAYDTAKQAGSEFYQPMQGSQDPFYQH